MDEMTVDEKIQQKLKLEQLKKRHAGEYQKVRTALQAAVKDTNTQIVLRHLAKICGFFKSDIVVNPTTNEVNPIASLHNEARRTVYLDIRRMLSDDIRRLIESKDEENHG